MNFYILMRFFRGRWTLHLGWNNPSYLFRKGSFNRGPIHRNSMYSSHFVWTNQDVMSRNWSRGPGGAWCIGRDARGRAYPCAYWEAVIWTDDPRNWKRNWSFKTAKWKHLIYKRRNVTFKHTFRTKTKIDDKRWLFHCCSSLGRLCMMFTPWS